MRQDSDFAYRMALIVSTGFAISTAGATYVDARIPSHVLYGARSYPYGYWVALLAIPLFIATLRLISRARSQGAKCLAGCLPLTVAVAATQWAFKPEVPNLGIVGACGIYAVTVLIATWLRTLEPDTAFLQDQSLAVQVRIEGLKSAITLWQGLSLATCAGVLAGVAPWPFVAMNANARIVNALSVSAAADLSLLNTFSTLQIEAIGVAVIIGPVAEVIGTVMRLSARFREIR